jgi:hypothetical protein
MRLLTDVLTELFSMFAGDWRMSVLVLALVGVGAAVVRLPGASLIAGGVLLAGCLAILTYTVLHAARSRR